MNEIKSVLDTSIQLKFGTTIKVSTGLAELIDASAERYSLIQTRLSSERGKQVGIALSNIQGYIIQMYIMLIHY